MIYEFCRRISVKTADSLYLRARFAIDIFTSETESGRSVMPGGDKKKGEKSLTQAARVAGAGGGKSGFATK
jgi:hypothetical protein